MSSKKRPAKKSPGRSGGMAPFIRTCPKTWKAKKVVEAGKKAGFDIPLRYVYSVRSMYKGKRTAGGAMSVGIGMAEQLRRFETRQLEDSFEDLVKRHATEVRIFVFRKVHGSL